MAGRKTAQTREEWEREVDALMRRAGVELGDELRASLVRDLAEQEPRGPRPEKSARRLAIVRAAGQVKAEERRLRSEGTGSGGGTVPAHLVESQSETEPLIWHTPAPL